MLIGKAMKSCRVDGEGHEIVAENIPQICALTPSFK